jgi:hypothetical protein
LACLLDTQAPPIQKPFKLLSSMSFAAKLFGGFLNTLPQFASPIG